MAETASAKAIIVIDEDTKSRIRKVLNKKKGEIEEKTNQAEHNLRIIISGGEKHNGMNQEVSDPSYIAIGNGKRITTLQKCLEKIKQSFVRLEKGTYGICENCGRPICLGRLEAIPFAHLCVRCKNSLG